MPGGLDPRGPIAGEIAGLWWLMCWLGAAVFLVFAAVLAVALFRRRRAAPEGTSAGAGQDEPGEAAARYVRRWIVGLGVVMTAAVLVVVLGFTIASMRAIPHQGGRDALAVDLVAHQFHWEVRYPGHGVATRNVVHIPVGRQVELRLTSADVIHSFWVPSLAGKMDALPDTTNTLVLQADEPGRYRGQCAEFCGLYHAHMEVAIVAMAPEEFAAWLARAA